MQVPVARGPGPGSVLPASQPISRAPSEVALSSESGRNPEPSIPVAETNGNDAIATLPDRCSGGGYRLSRGRETSCHRRPPLGRALITTRVSTEPVSWKTAITLVTPRPESPAHPSVDRYFESISLQQTVRLSPASAIE